ncbi:MAG: LppX_LprAFG lipoprotein [Pseudonocardiaceae bacterium]|nr:LppX_LprAFG lipoprotein [Pseudonocardiaceae bacterium]
MLRVPRVGPVSRVGPVPCVSAVIGTVVFLAALLSGCESDPDASGRLPEASSILRTAAQTSRGLHSGHFDISVNGRLPGVNVESAKGALTRRDDGKVDAKGTAKVQQFGQLLEMEFVLIDPSVYIKGPTGGFSKAPASMVTNVYDPSVLLDDKRGIANLLSNLRRARTEGRETVSDVETVRVGGTLAKDKVAPIVPGIQSDVEAKFWLSEGKSREPVRAWFQLPPQRKGSGARMIEVSLSKLNEPVTVRAPK